MAIFEEAEPPTNLFRSLPPVYFGTKLWCFGMFGKLPLIISYRESGDRRSGLTYVF